MTQQVSFSSSSSTSTDGATAVATRPRLRGRLHAVAAALSVGALVWLVRSANTVEATVAAWIYGLAAILCYSASSAYHVLARTERARGLLRRADHSMIYVLIAGTFTPICLLAMTGWWRWLVIAVVWLGALVGMTLCLSPKKRLARTATAMYLILGWAGLAALPALWGRPDRVAALAIAGLLYTVGAILFGTQRPRLHPKWFGYHEFWHCMGVAAGAILFFVNLSLIAAPRVLSAS